MRIRIECGVIAIARDDYETTFGDAAAVVVMRKGRALWVVPVMHAEAGGSIVKIRNAARDRAIDARDMLRREGVDDGVRRELAASWDPSQAALVADGVFS